VEGEVDDPALVRSRMVVDRLGLYAPPTHPLANGTPRLDDLWAAAWVLREPGSGTRSHMERGFAAAGLPIAELRVLLEAPSNEACLAAAVAGGLVTVVSDLAARPHVGAGRVTRLDFELPPRAFELLVHRPRRRSRAATAFMAFV
jgi:DNA-binding transcriptional LysR family regulator